MSIEEKIREKIVADFTTESADAIAKLLMDNMPNFHANGLRFNNLSFCIGRAVAYHAHGLFTDYGETQLKETDFEKLGHHCYEFIEGYNNEINKLTGKTINPMPINTVKH